MDLIEVLINNRTEIINKSVNLLNRAHLKNYNELNETERTKKLSILYDLALKCIKNKNIIDIVEYSEKIAAERFNKGFDFHEVHTAFNVLEEAMWESILNNMAPEEYGEALGFVSTVLGAGKESLANTFIQLSAKTKVRNLDLSSLR
ncbi:MAG: hypothetical protein ACM3O3_00810 [Syntrophothermus sp.]